MAVATENTIFGDTSIRSIFFFWNSEVSSRKRPDTLLWTKCPSSSNWLVCLCNNEVIFLVCCQVYNLIRNHRVGRIGFIYYTVRSFDETVLIDTVRKHARELIRPMFGPSGVSIGHIRP